MLVLRNAAVIAGVRNHLMLRAAAAGGRAGQRQWRWPACCGCELQRTVITKRDCGVTRQVLKLLWHNTVEAWDSMQVRHTAVLR